MGPKIEMIKWLLPTNPHKPQISSSSSWSVIYSSPSLVFLTLSIYRPSSDSDNFDKWWCIDRLNGNYPPTHINHKYHLHDRLSTSLYLLSSWLSPSTVLHLILITLTSEWCINIMKSMKSPTLVPRFSLATKS